LGFERAGGLGKMYYRVLCVATAWAVLMHFVPAKESSLEAWDWNNIAHPSAYYSA
jgi:hypothetical protein